MVLSPVRTGSIPLEVADARGYCVQAIAGQVELSQGQDLAHGLGEHAQAVVREIQALELGKPVGKVT